MPGLRGSVFLVECSALNWQSLLSENSPNSRRARLIAAVKSGCLFLESVFFFGFLGSFDLSPQLGEICLSLVSSANSLFGGKPPPDSVSTCKSIRSRIRGLVELFFGILGSLRSRSVQVYINSRSDPKAARQGFIRRHECECGKGTRSSRQRGNRQSVPPISIGSGKLSISLR